jgi:hypothetical protein
MGVIPIPRFAHDLEREALEVRLLMDLKELARVSTAEQFSGFFRDLSRVAMATGKRLPSNTGLPSPRAG